MEAERWGIANKTTNSRWMKDGKIPSCSASVDLDSARRRETRAEMSGNAIARIADHCCNDLADGGVG